MQSRGKKEIHRYVIERKGNFAWIIRILLSQFLKLKIFPNVFDNVCRNACCSCGIHRCVFHSKNFQFNSIHFLLNINTDCHLSNTEQTTKPMSIELINPKPLHEINALPSLICIEPYDTHFCLNGGRCFNITVATYSFPSCECAIGYMGERCERKYLNRSYNPEHYMKADDIVTSQNRSNVGEPKIVLSHSISGRCVVL